MGDPRFPSEVAATARRTVALDGCLNKAAECAQTRMEADDNSGDGYSIERDSDVKLDTLMEIARDCLADQIDPRDFILGSASFIKFEEEREILRSPRVEGAKKIFDLAINRKKSPELLQLLKQNHAAVADRLLNEDILSLCRKQSTNLINQDEEYSWRVMHLLRGKLYEKVNPHEILPHLQAGSFLSAAESEEILEKSTRFDACLELVTTLARKRITGSYDCLLKALIDCDMREAAEEIDPDRVKEISKLVEEGSLTNNLSRKRNWQNVEFSTASDVAEADSTSQAYPVDGFSKKRHLPEVSTPHATTSQLAAGNAADSIRCKTVGNSVQANSGAGPVAIRCEPLPDLRPYQKEVAEPALRGLNCVICMPTNSGKTIVAAHVIAEHLSTKEGEAHVAFVAPQVALVNQQYWLLKKYLGDKYNIRCITGDAPEAFTPLQVSKENHILVLTPQILVNALEGVYAGDDNSASSRIDSLGIFTLLIIDECHHCNKGSPYNKMMSCYVKDKSQGLSPLPQVIGLTATLGVGKARCEDAAVKYILNICANLACEEPPKTVQREIKSLEACVNVPLKERHVVPDRLPNKFSDCILKAMQRLESILLTEFKETPLAKIWLLPNFYDPLKPAYGHRIHEMTKDTKERLGAFSRKMEIANICLAHLQVYWKALDIWQYARSKDAYKHLEHNMPVIDTASSKEPKNVFEETKQQLESLLDLPEDNPRLDELARIITSMFSIGDTENDRGLIFVNTRELTGALCDWAKELNGGAFNILNPKPFTGVHSPAGSGGLTANEQDEVLKAFRAGETRLLVCTSVAEEGLDIPQCKFCVQYLRASNVISSIQAKGRVRAANGVAHTISSEEGERKEELTWLRETLMEQAMAYICEMEPEIFKTKIKEYQRKNLLAKEIAEGNITQQLPKVDNSVRLHCGRCDSNAVASSGLRVFKEAHHIVTDLRFEELVSMRPANRHERMGRDMIKDRKVSCKKCAIDWGIAMTMRGCSFFVLKIDPFVVITQDGKRNTYKKWKDFPFELKSIEDMELMEIGKKKITNLEQS